VVASALEDVWLGRYGELRRAIRVNPALAFAASRLCRAPCGVLPREDLDAALLKEQLGASVEDLIRENLLGVRPRSRWARDVPAEAFPRKCDEVVTASSAVDMYCLKGLKEEGLLPEASQAPQLLARQSMVARADLRDLCLRLVG
jgi:hypothetical protein